MTHYWLVVRDNGTSTFTAVKMIVGAAVWPITAALSRPTARMDGAVVELNSYVIILIHYNLDSR